MLRISEVSVAKGRRQRSLGSHACSMHGACRGVLGCDRHLRKGSRMACECRRAGYTIGAVSEQLMLQSPLSVSEPRSLS